MRLSAFTIDLVAIYFVGYSVEMAAREQAMQLGPFLPFLGGVMVFTYFWLGNGPVGKGATLGKAILNLHTIQTNKSKLTLNQSFKRTLIQMPLIFASCFHLLDDLFHFPALVSFLGGQVFAFGAITLILTNGYSMIAQPWKQGWHDIAVGSFVTPDPTPIEFDNVVHFPPDPYIDARIRANRRFSPIFCVLVGALMIGQPFLVVFSKHSRTEMEMADRARRSVSIDGYQLRRVQIPSEKQVARAQSSSSVQGSTLASSQTTARESALTSATLAVEADTSGTLERDGFGPGEALVFRFAKIWGEAQEDDMKSSRARDEIEKLRRSWRKTYEEVKQPGKAENPPVKGLVATFTDPFRFASDPLVYLMDPFRWLIMSQADHVWAVHGPIDPEKGELIYEWIPHPLATPTPQPKPVSTPITTPQSPK